MAEGHTYTEYLEGPDTWTWAIMEKYAEQFGPVGFIREFTQNGIDAIRRLPKRRKKEFILWDYSRIHGQKGRNLMVADTGIGMSPDDMRHNVRKMLTSSGTIDLAHNHGLGGRGSAAAYNPEGVTWYSWQGGVGHFYTLSYIRKEKRFGFVGGVQPIPEGFKEKLLGHLDKRYQIEDHGTVVVFHGQGPDDDTFAPRPRYSADKNWITKVLNERRAYFPDGIEVHARTMIGKPNRKRKQEEALCEVKGTQHHLVDNAQVQGEKLCEGGEWIQYYIMPEGYEFPTRTLQHAHAAIVKDGELYERKDARMLNNFGFCRTGTRAVLYVTPPGKIKVEENRKRVLINGQEPPWEQWANEFMSPLPEDVARLEGEAARGEDHDLDDYVNQVLESLLKDLEPGKYMKCEPEEATTEAGEFIYAGTKPGTDDTICRRPDPDAPPRIRRKSGKDTDGDNIYSPEKDRSGKDKNAKGVGGGHRIPTFTVVHGDEVDDKLKPYVARYTSFNGTTLINGDHSTLRKLRDEGIEAAGSLPLGRQDTKAAAMKAVMAFTKIQLGQAILHAYSLNKADVWTTSDVSFGLNEHALTTAMGPHRHLIEEVARYLKGKKPKRWIAQEAKKAA